ncbi:MAG: hypothetical protein HY928_01495, partial [Elusimicrobia bacterium]|nr:hypothetical protein [Elusimicrobiota bacterium]
MMRILGAAGLAVFAAGTAFAAPTPPARDKAAKALGASTDIKSGVTVGKETRPAQVLSDKDAAALPPPLVSAADFIREGRAVLASMAAGLAAKDARAAFARVDRNAAVSLAGKAAGLTDLKRELASSLTLLDNPRWTYDLLSSSYDKDTGKVRLKVKSSYSADLMEPLGVTSASIPVPEEVKAFQRSFKESLKASGEETYELAAGSGRLRIVSMTSYLPFVGKGPVAERISRVLAEWKVKVAVFALFERVEKNDPTGFAALVDGSFLNADDNGFRHSRSDFLESAKADLDHLTSIDHTVRVRDIRLDPDLRTARAPLDWDRRARIANSRKEWTVSGRVTTLGFEKDGEAFRLSRIEGNALFGNSSRWTRKTLTAAGELDGTKVTTYQSVGDTRVLGNAVAADYPENSKALADSASSDAAVSCPVGNSQTFNFTGAVQQFDVPTACQLTIKVWGAGGGGGGWDVGLGGHGGGGAYSTTQVALANGTALKVYVAGGGGLGTSSANNTGGGAGGFGYGAGARGGHAGGQAATTSGAGGGGGGSSAVTDQAGTT